LLICQGCPSKGIFGWRNLAKRIFALGTWSLLDHLVVDFQGIVLNVHSNRRDLDLAKISE